MFDEAAHSFAKMGIGVSAPKLDLPSMMNFKQQGIDGNVKGVEFLMKKNKITVINGRGKILSTGKVEVSGADGKTLSRFVVGKKLFKSEPENPDRAPGDGRFILQPGDEKTAAMVSDPLPRLHSL
jgi:hypothetical protein